MTSWLAALTALTAWLCLAPTAATQLVLELPVLRTFEHGGAWSLATGDVTGDDLPDIVTADQIFGSQITVLVNNGEGGFTVDPPVFTSSTVRQVALADADGDEQLDLFATVGTFQRSIIFAKGFDNGTFGPETPVWQGFFPHFALADVTGEGFLDVVVASQVPPQVSVARGLGDGTFQTPQVVTVITDGEELNDIAVGDLDGDDVADIVLGGRDDERLWVVMNQGNGVFDLPVTYFPGFPVSHVLVGDFDGDATLDVAAGTDESVIPGRLGVLLNDGAGVLDLPLNRNLNPTLADMQVARLDDDDVDDVVGITGFSPVEPGFNRGVTALRGQGDGTLDQRTIVTINDNLLRVATGDFDLDGLDDLAVTGLFFDPPGIVLTMHNHTYPADSPFTDVGFSLANPDQYPILVADGTLLPDEDYSFTVQRGRPGNFAFLVAGTSAIYLPFAGGTMVPAPDTILDPVPIIANSQALVLGTWPAGVPSGLTFWIQYWMSDDDAETGFAATNAVEVTVP